jgi:hypothetical protein
MGNPMATKIELPEQEIIETYKKNVWWTSKKLAKKYKTTEYRIKKILTTAGVWRNTAHLEKHLIQAFLKYERQFDTKTVGIEMMIARKLIAEYPEEDFWKGFDLGFKLNSLAFLQSDKGQAFLNKKYGEFKFEIPVAAQHNIGTEKVGEDIPVVSKPMSIHDFMTRK